MELDDIMKLVINTPIRTCLNNHTVEREWFNGTLDKVPSIHTTGEVQVYMNKEGYGMCWSVKITERNKQYFKLLCPEWDGDSNE